MKLSLLFSFCILSLISCGRNADLTPKIVQGYFSASTQDNTDEEACQKIFRQSIKPALKHRFPRILEKAAVYSGGSAFKPAEIRGLVVSALLQKAEGAKSGAEAAEWLKPAMADFLALDSTILNGLTALPPGQPLSPLLTKLAGRLLILSFNQMEILRSRTETVAEWYQEELRMILSGLPEEKSRVTDITALIWDKLNRNVNDVKIEEALNLLKGAYPGMF